jgi:hypothetical protein
LATLGSAGFVSTTLVVPTVRLAAHDDVLVKHGIKAVRVGESRLATTSTGGWWSTARSTSAVKAIRPLRWGLWEAVVNIDLGAIGPGGTRRIVDRLAGHGGQAVIAADATLLSASAKLLPRLIEHLCRRRNEGSLIIDTLAGAVARQHMPRHSPARSILHPAAA